MTSSSVSVPLALKPTPLLLEKCRTVSQVRQIHAHMIKTNLFTHTLSVAKLISVCSRPAIPGGLQYALLVLLRIQNPTSSLFHPLIKAFSDSSDPSQAVALYAHMLSCLENLQGIEFCVPSALKACGRFCAFEEGLQILGFIMKTHLWCDPFVTNSVVRMCLEVGEIELAGWVFDNMPVRDLISWNSLITGYLRMGEIRLARELFEKMPERDLVSCKAMIDGYGKHGKCEFVEEVFMTVESQGCGYLDKYDFSLCS